MKMFHVSRFTQQPDVEKPHTLAKFSGGVVYFSPGRCVPFNVEGPLEGLEEHTLVQNPAKQLGWFKYGKVWGFLQ